MHPGSWTTPHPPTVAIEIASRRVTVVALGHGGTVVAGCAAEPLPDGAVAPALTGGNVPEPGVVTEALVRALDRAGLASVRRAALVVPDSIARVSLLPFEQVPARQQDLDKVLRWQLRKATPFPLADAQITQFVASSEGPGISLAAVVARRDVVSEYEAVVAAAGIHAGLVDLASFSVMNAIMGAGVAPAGDWLLVHIASDATTLAILRGESLLFYRHRTAVDEESLSALVHQTAMYHEDRLGGGPFARVWLAGAGQQADEARSQIGGRLGMGVDPVDVRTAAALDASVASPDLLDALTAPVGLLVRERQAA